MRRFRQSTGNSKCKTSTQSILQERCQGQSSEKIKVRQINIEIIEPKRDSVLGNSTNIQTRTLKTEVEKWYPGIRVQNFK